MDSNVRPERDPFRFHNIAFRIFIFSVFVLILRQSPFFTPTRAVYNERGERSIFINSSKILSSPVGFRKMIILLVYTLVFYQLQLGESVVHHKWQQVQDRFWPYYRTRIKQENEMLLLLDRPTLEQRRWIDIKHESSPADLIHVQTRSFCACESQYEVRDLGDNHYPRYLTASYCKLKTCQNKFHPCKMLYYMVHILRPRETNVPSKWFTDDDEIPETPLPEFLRRKWQMKPLSVPVACVPA